MFGAYSSEANSIFIAEVNFITHKITYSKYLQYTGNSYHGVIFDSDKFFIASMTSTDVVKSTS